MGWIFMLGVVVGILVAKFFNRFIDWLMEDSENIDGGGYHGE